MIASAICRRATKPSAPAGQSVSGRHDAARIVGRAARRRPSCAEDSRRQYRGIARVVDPHARDRDAGRHLRDRQQRIEPAGNRGPARQRHADHGQIAVRSHDAGQRRRQAGAGDDYTQTAQPRVARVVGYRVGSRWADITLVSSRSPRADNSRSAASIAGMSLFEPITIPTSGWSTSSCSSSVRATASVCGPRSLTPAFPARSRHTQRDSLRSCLPSNSIMFAAA